MLTTAHRRVAAVIAVAGLAAATLAGCGGANADDGTADSPITLKISTFGESGNMQQMVKQYEADHPGIKIEFNTVASAEDARTNMLTKMAAGTGLSDVEQIETSWVGGLRQYADKFVPVEEDSYGGWLPSQAEPVTVEGKMFAYGIGTGPEAICYRADMFKDAGLPSDPESVATMVGDTWEEYIAAGQAYAAAGGKGKWYDSSYMTFVAKVEQMKYPFEDAGNNIVVDSPELEKVFKDTLAEADKLSAKLAPFSEDWNAGFASGKFATIGCPSWLLESIEGNSVGVKTWNIANAFPGGGSSMGGSYFAVPTQSKYPKQASELAAWLTSPEQQIAAFKAGSAFPSRLKAMESEDLLSQTSEYFGNAPVGKIFTDRSKAATTVMYKGPNYLAIDTAAFNAMSRVEEGIQSIDDAWKQFVTEAKAAAK